MLCLFHRIRCKAARKYQFVGQMVQWSVRHGGPGLPVFSPAFYRLLTDGSISADDVQYIADVDVRQRVQQVRVFPSNVSITCCPQCNYFMCASTVQQQTVNSYCILSITQIITDTSIGAGGIYPTGARVPPVLTMRGHGRARKYSVRTAYWRKYPLKTDFLSPIMSTHCDCLSVTGNRLAFVIFIWLTYYITYKRHTDFTSNSYCKLGGTCPPVREGTR